MARRSLTELASNHDELRIYRIVNPRSALRDTLAKLIPRERITEALAELSELPLEELLDGPFKRKRAFGGRYGPATRFSDGTVPVFYASEDGDTACEEKAFHVATCEAGASGVGTHRLQLFSCIFSGERADLTPHSWPELKQGPPYLPAGHELGRSVWEHDALDALKAASARKNGGVNSPAFKRRSISAPRIERELRIRVDRAVGTARFELL